MTKKQKKVGAPFGNKNNAKYEGVEVARVVFLVPEKDKLNWKKTAQEKGMSLTDLILERMKIYNKKDD